MIDMNFNREYFGRDIKKNAPDKPFFVRDPKGRIMMITGEYELGGGKCFFAAEEVPPYGKEFILKKT